ncbi:hypothetical protein KP509_31G013800 [Ceratopteris richardii]|uniref:Uncharacterized protein n=1 Tax=Ceratopteris richardii TaxID=49495 RepID=A0A8T2QX17_CERRI|nr:hypothetical protein KP509_31G013800 [Ceratopteris richardii]
MDLGYFHTSRKRQWCEGNKNVQRKTDKISCDLRMLKQPAASKMVSSGMGGDALSTERNRKDAFVGCKTDNLTGVSDLQVWADRYHEAIYEGRSKSMKSGSEGIPSVYRKKRMTQNFSKPQNSTEGKENIDPSPSAQLNRRSSPLPPWIQRYPLQDISALIQILQGFDMRGGYEVSSTTTPRVKEPRDLKDSSTKGSALLHMR